MSHDTIKIESLRHILYALTPETFEFLLSFLKTGKSEAELADIFLFLFCLQDIEDFAERIGVDLVDSDSPENPSDYVLCLHLIEEGKRLNAKRTFVP